MQIAKVIVQAVWASAKEGMGFHRGQTVVHEVKQALVARLAQVLVKVGILTIAKPEAIVEFELQDAVYMEYFQQGLKAGYAKAAIEMQENSMCTGNWCMPRLMSSDTQLSIANAMASTTVLALKHLMPLLILIMYDWARKTRAAKLRTKKQGKLRLPSAGTRTAHQRQNPELSALTRTIWTGIMLGGYVSVCVTEYHKLLYVVGGICVAGDQICERYGEALCDGVPQWATKIRGLGDGIYQAWLNCEVYKQVVAIIEKKEHQLQRLGEMSEAQFELYVRTGEIVMADGSTEEALSGLVPPTEDEVVLVLAYLACGVLYFLDGKSLAHPIGIVMGLAIGLGPTYLLTGTLDIFGLRGREGARKWREEKRKEAGKKKAPGEIGWDKEITDALLEEVRAKLEEMRAKTEAGQEQLEGWKLRDGARRVIAGSQTERMPADRWTEEMLDDTWEMVPAFETELVERETK